MMNVSLSDVKLEKYSENCKVNVFLMVVILKQIEEIKNGHPYMDCKIILVYRPINTTCHNMSARYSQVLHTGNHLDIKAHTQTHTYTRKTYNQQRLTLSVHKILKGFYILYWNYTFNINDIKTEDSKY